MASTFLENAEALRQNSVVVEPTGVPEAKRPSGHQENYIQGQDKNWWCLSCGGAVMGKTVYHPVWDGPFPCSGSGQVETSVAPFCPVCEIEPSESGWPIERDKYGVKGNTIAY